MAGQLIKLLVASVYNLRVQLILFDFILFFLILAIFWRWDPFSKMLFCRKKLFPVHVVISVFQTFNYRCLEISVHDIFFLFILKPRSIGIRACLILIQETLCFLDVNLQCI